MLLRERIYIKMFDYTYTLKEISPENINFTINAFPKNSTFRTYMQILILPNACLSFNKSNKHFNQCISIPQPGK